MARQRSKQARDGTATPTRHPLLVYYNLGKRYRGPGILLILMGALAFVPSIVDFDKNTVAPSTLATLGVVLVLVGLAFWLFSTLAIRRAYVQCNPDLLVIRTPFHQILVSYRRIKQVQPVQVAQIFPRDSLKGMGKPLMTPLLSRTAVEVHVKSWPAPKKRLMRLLSKYLFSSRAEAWLFIVPDYSALLRQLDAATQNKVDESRNVQTTYQDPFERLRYYGN